ncbi:MAG: glycosyltransferase family 2 protein [Anaerolineae bacterium]|nr:glycosyltransferase family 2 protein [Anaerolineae bacterium]
MKTRAGTLPDLSVELSIVITSWNTEELLAQCLQSLAGTRAEVIVVDNASADGSVAMIKRSHPHVQLVENRENLGFARANNQGIAMSRGRYVALLNSDTRVYDGAFDRLVAFMDTHPRAGGCGPRLVNADGSLQPSCHPVLTPGRELWRLLFLDYLWRRATYAQATWAPNRPHQVEVIKGACLVLRREALSEVGVFDDRYFMYTEEMDLCYRLLRAGWEMWWVPDATVLHYGEASSRQVAESMYVELYRSKAQFHRKFGGERRVKAFKGYLYVAYVPRLLLFGAGARLSNRLATRARIYRRLVSEVPRM